MRKHCLPFLVISLTLCGSAFLLSNNKSNSIPLLAENETHVIHLGDKITVEDRQLSYQDEHQNVKGRIVLPSGGT